MQICTLFWVEFGTKYEDYSFALGFYLLLGTIIENSLHIWECDDNMLQMH